MCLNPVYLNTILMIFLIIAILLLGYDILRTILFTKKHKRFYGIYKSSANIKFLILLISGIFLWIYIGNIYILYIVLVFLINMFFHTFIIKDGFYENGLLYDEYFINWSQVSSYEMLTSNKVKLLIKRKIFKKVYDKTQIVMVKEMEADLESFLKEHVSIEGNSKSFDNE